MTWKDRLKLTLEPILLQSDPRLGLSAYHDMPYAIFHYPPQDEFALRQELSLLKTRLEQMGKRITIISLAECLATALANESVTMESLADAEKNQGTEAVVQTIFEILSDYQPLDQLVAQRMPDPADPLQDIVFINRTGSLYPMYRTHALLEQLMGRVQVPSVLFYPGELDGTTGLKFMGILEPDANYRPRIF